MFQDERSGYYASPPIGQMAGAQLLFSDITANFVDLIDLGTSRLYSHVAIVNATDVLLDIQWGTSGDIVPLSNLVEGLVFDNFLLQGKVSIKAPGALPSNGAVIGYFW